MDHETKLSPGQIGDLLSALQHADRQDTVNVDAFVKAHLTSEQAAAVQKLLQNPALVKALLQSPQAKKLAERFGGKGEA